MAFTTLPDCISEEQMLISIVQKHPALSSGSMKISDYNVWGVDFTIVEYRVGELIQYYINVYGNKEVQINNINKLYDTICGNLSLHTR